MQPPEYCRVQSEEFKPLGTLDGDTRNISTIRSIDLPEFSWLICYLNQHLTNLLTELADARATRPDRSPKEEYDEFDDFGGWSVLIENRVGAVIELGISRNHWLIIGRSNCSFRIVTLNEFAGGNHGFNLFQSCFTDFRHEELMSKSKCFEFLESWLEDAESPEDRGITK